MDVRRRLLIFACAVLFGVGQSYAQILPQIFFHKHAATGGGCSNVLDFSQACNSQYIGVIL